MREWLENWSALGAANGPWASPAIITDRLDDVFDLLCVNKMRVLHCRETALSPRVIHRDNRRVLNGPSYRYVSKQEQSDV